MLRQALDAAQDKQQEQDSRLKQATETDSLLAQETPREQGYESTADNNKDNEEEPYEAGDSRSYDDDDDDEDESLSDEDSAEGISREPTRWEFIWTKIKGCIILVMNVENLWDSPSQNSQRTPSVSRRNKYVVLLWFFILATSYAAERTTFKLLVDRTGPFRLFAVEMVTFTHAILVAMGMLISSISRKDFSMEPLGIPIVDVGLMALLDTVHLLLVFLTGMHVAPTLTAILVQFTLPLTALLTQFVHPDGASKRCCGQTTQSEPPAPPPNVSAGEGIPQPGCGGLSIEHISGSIIISLAVLLALCPSIYSILDPVFFLYADTIPIQTAYNTLLFVSGCIPAAASQLYKEHIFLQYKQPVQQDYLNFVLSLFQLIFASIMAPLVYTLQGLAASDDWTSLYPSSGFSKNFYDGFQCFMGMLDEDRALNFYDDEALCNYSFGLVFLHAFAIIAVGVAVDKIVNAGATKVMYRGVSAGIIFSVTSLYIYDMNIPDFSYGPALDSLNVVCVLLLVVGSEVYHRVSLQDATFETVYPEIDNFYDDLE